jgi:hypothetical protein
LEKLCFEVKKEGIEVSGIINLLRKSGRQKDYFEKIIIESIMVLLKMPLNAL